MLLSLVAVFTKKQPVMHQLPGFMGKNSFASCSSKLEPAEIAKWFYVEHCSKNTGNLAESFLFAVELHNTGCCIGDLRHIASLLTGFLDTSSCRSNAESSWGCSHFAVARKKWNNF